MEIDFYGSNLCPRCRKVHRQLNEFKEDYPELQINFIEVINSPLKTISNKILMIPALKTEKQKLSGVFLSKEQLALFLEKEQENRK